MYGVLWCGFVYLKIVVVVWEFDKMGFCMRLCGFFFMLGCWRLLYPRCPFFLCLVLCGRVESFLERIVLEILNLFLLFFFFDIPG